MARNIENNRMHLHQHTTQLHKIICLPCQDCHPSEGKNEQTKWADDRFHATLLDRCIVVQDPARGICHVLLKLLLVLRIYVQIIRSDVFANKTVNSERKRTK